MRMLSALVSTLLLTGALSAQTPPARPNGLYTTLHISHGGQPLGSITMKLHETETPVTVKNFVDLALGRKLWTDPKTGARVRRPFYDGLTFHRVMENFMIQGGDPTGTGQGDTEHIKDEFYPTLKFDGVGRLAMANAGPGTGSCQFFITETPQTRLDGRYTIFGQVVQGQELVGRIARVPKMGERPTTPVVITKVTFERIGPVPPGGIVLGPAPRAVTKAPAKKAPAKAPAKK